MKKKMAFTLVELLAVIVILAIILVIAVPQISNVIKETRKNAIASTAKMIAAKAEEVTIENEILGNNGELTCSSLVKLDDDYDSSTCVVRKINGEWNVSISGSSTGKFSNLLCTGTKFDVNCINSDLAQDEYLGVDPCTYDGELVDGATFVYGDYKYTYIANEYKPWLFYPDEKYEYENDLDELPQLATPTVTTTGGWHVQVNWPTTTAATPTSATSLICSSINRKPIISTAGMYKYIQDVDLSTLDTSNVIDMAGMFWNANISNLDVSNFDTSKVIRMNSMFSGFGYTPVVIQYSDGYWDEWYVDTSETQITGLDHFNTENVLNMYGMFRGIKANTLDLSGFDTSKVVDFERMLIGLDVPTIYASNKFDTTASLSRCSNPEYDCYRKIISGPTGGNGTDCRNNHHNDFDITYARIDAPGQPGCFTAKP